MRTTKKNSRKERVIKDTNNNQIFFGKESVKPLAWLDLFRKELDADITDYKIMDENSLLRQSIF